jgi:hypothetical protein
MHLIYVSILLLLSKNEVDKFRIIKKNNENQKLWLPSNSDLIKNNNARIWYWASYSYFEVGVT